MPLLERLLQRLARHGKHLVLQRVRVVRSLHEPGHQRIGRDRAEPVYHFLLYVDLTEVCQPQRQHGNLILAVKVLHEGVQVPVTPLRLHQSFHVQTHLLDFFETDSGGLRARGPFAPVDGAFAGPLPFS